MRNKVIESVEKEKIIVIVRGIAKESLIPMTEAMYEGGVRLLEITYDATGKTPDEETAANIEMLAKHFEGRMFIGAGTVIRPNQVELTAKAGGAFIISPDTNKEIIEKTRELGLVSMPGALTPTEIADASRFGADFVKLFPVTTFGPEYVKAVKAPLAHVKLLAVGGVDASNMEEYLKAGISGFGIGSNIVNKKLIEAGEFGKITELAKEFIGNIK
ncbi:MAG: bifunctional 4-hydroxy-2-oxoglutarate aldolase/2-dehydro-3-deoxy-phosphogluconate aldolase [Clostridia bacterium]|nr:bifunctional 4-hydroxy-2-oxoglutarate aldolase/2-dehydro-3-deoxy-phosphogluconate aldolase [Clostridia bacterium]